ncbi:uncharacterized protein LOC126785304 [Argentina anserina]|uniref:uncharacterized protein LOC126785304 n=1 Tax=Argentina anserina TaxID=57926 RepID=UPI00217689B0|nr:uncharacterized protein LOC126785304 [Potentilla anserina]
MEVAIPSRPTLDFDFNSARSSPCVTAPSTPRRFGDYSFLSAPTSPSRISEFYREFDEFSVVSSNWEEEDESELAAPPKSPKADDFAFDVGEEVDRVSLSAEELFDGGVIRPMKPTPPPQSTKKMNICQSLSPRRRKDRDQNGYELHNSTGMETPQKRSTGSSQQGRGRERAPAPLSSSSRRASRSLSPLRVSEFNWAKEEEELKRQQAAAKSENKQLATKGSLISSATAALNSYKASRKWRLKDFLLFRSASEGRATDKDPFSKFSNRKNELVKTASSSFKSIDSPASVSSSRRRGPSAHELHYTVNKAVSEDMKKKTFLPYKQGILGRLAFNPAVHSLATGFGTLSKS